MSNLVLLLTLLTLSSHPFGSFGCHKEELDALLRVKSVINYPNGDSLPTWKEEGMGRPSNCCNWEMVFCGERGRVDTLSLSELRQTSWYLNASIFLPFRDLQHLYLSFNSIIGWFEHLRDLSSLKELDLGYNKLKGIIDLSDFEALQHLQTLDLSGNNVDGFKRIRGTLHSSNRKLETLFLDSITFQDADMLLDSLLYFPSLKSLHLSGNNFTGTIKTDAFKNLQQLEMLYLPMSSLSQSFLQKVGTMDSLEMLIMSSSTLKGEISSHGWLCQLKRVQTLDLSQNDLQGQLPSCLLNLTSLHLLDLSFNQLNGNIANSPISKLTSLQFLSLSHNKFEIFHSFISFANHSSLKLLSLNGNTVVPDDSSTHQPFVPKIQLSFLSLSNCNIGPTLPQFILNQYNLTFLDLSHNYIGGSFPPWIVENNIFLDTLVLADNLFIGSFHLPRHPHSRVTVLDVSNNNISYLSTNLSRPLPNILFLNLSRNSIKDITPFNLSDMKELSILDLSYNHFTGEMPTHFIKGCSSLKVLHLNDNNFSRTIPSSLFQTSLEFLDMSNNLLGGQIPAEICKLTYLISLDLSNNDLSGFLPSCFHAPYLTYVYLNKNRLNGPLLPVFRKSTSLVALDLGDNHLSGAIPEWINDSYNLNILSLRNNHFEGHIPTQFCSLDQLTIVDLSSNNISGPLPRCLSEMTFQPHEVISVFPDSDIIGSYPTTEALEVFFIFFDLKHSSFVISIQSFTNLNEMEVTTKSHTYTYLGTDLDGMSGIDLSCNKLSGDIPLEIGGMIGARALNLSHNELTGSIPSTLSKLSQIESLDLSYNLLNGSIPADLIQLNALAVFTVAHNNLSGRIPEPKAQFATFGESSYKGNPFLCGPPLLEDCSTSSLQEDQVLEDVDDAMDMHIFYICFFVSFVIMFFGTLVVLYVNSYWRGVWFSCSEMWISWIYYFIVDGIRNTW